MEDVAEDISAFSKSVMSILRTSLAGVLATALLSGSISAQDEQPEGVAPESVGNVRFVTSCHPSVEKQFDRAMAALHSFWFSEAIKTFNSVLQADPQCAMAYWGLAMSHWGYRRQVIAMRAGLAAVEKAEGELKKATTQRERDYIAAVALLFKNFEKIDHRTRTLAYEKAMQQVAERYPADREAAIFYALALGQTVVPTDKTFANRLKAGAILEKEFQSQPDHPGIAHYIIHSYDVPQLANRAVEAARRYAKIAPSVPHALHMPSHTFTRLGYWEESIAANSASAAAARTADSPDEWLHAVDYLVYAYLQTGQDRAAKRLVDEVGSVTRGRERRWANLFAIAAIPARFALERHAWAEATELEPYPSDLPYTKAMTHFARALGFARTGNPSAAKTEIEQITAVRDKLIETRNFYWAEQVEIQRLTATAWTAWAEGANSEALTLLRAAANREDASEKAAVTPGPLMPARELLGDILVELKQPRQALNEYEATMQQEPKRFWGVYGGARAAELSGDPEKARRYYEQLLEICGQADRPQRPELRKARAVVSDVIR